MGLPFLEIIETWKLMGPQRSSVPAFHCIDKESETRREDVACPGSRSSRRKEQRSSPVARALQPQRLQDHAEGVLQPRGGLADPLPHLSCTDEDSLRPSEGNWLMGGRDEARGPCPQHA